MANLKITKKYLRFCIRQEREIIKGLKKEIKQGKEHYKKSYPLSLCEGKIKAYKELLKNA